MRITGLAMLLLYAFYASAQEGSSRFQVSFDRVALPDAPSTLARLHGRTNQDKSGAPTLPAGAVNAAFQLRNVTSGDSSLVFVGTKGLPEKHSEANVAAAPRPCARYYWRGMAERREGDSSTSVVANIFDPSDHNCAQERGGFFKRGFYAFTRVLITPGYQGLSAINASELLGRGMTQAIATNYYPAPDRTFGVVAGKFGYAVGRDALQSVFREFWPDFAKEVLRRYPSAPR